jgi:hypothetical protein
MRSSGSSLGWRVFYSLQSDLRAQLTVLNYAYKTISRAFPGWTLTDIKGLTTRERRFWLAYAAWERGALNMITDNKPNA